MISYTHTSKRKEIDKLDFIKVYKYVHQKIPSTEKRAIHRMGVNTCKLQFS